MTCNCWLLYVQEKFANWWKIMCVAIVATNYMGIVSGLVHYNIDYEINCLLKHQFASYKNITLILQQFATTSYR